MKRSILVGVDVGSNKIVTVVGEISEDESINVVGVGEAHSKGIRRGVIVDVEDSISSIALSLDKAERMSGYPIRKVVVGVGGSHISSSNSKGVIAVSRADGEISTEDVMRVIEAARAVSLPGNREILHVLPRDFTVDGQEGVKDPVGMSGVRLEVEAHLVSGATAPIRNLVKCVEHTGVEVEGLFLNPLASAHAVLTKMDKELGCALIDIGGGTTGIAVFVEGSIWHSAILPIGGDHITNDIAIGLRIPFEVADKVKIGAYSEEENKKETLDLENYGLESQQEISLELLREIIDARVEEILNLVSVEVKKCTNRNMLPGGVIVTGGGSLTAGIKEKVKDYLRLPVRVGYPSGVGGLIEKVSTPSFATGVGILRWAYREVNVWQRSYGGKKVKDFWHAIVSWFKRAFL